MRKVVREYGFTFPVALDDDWECLDRMWLTTERRFTSASVLIDRKGFVRWVHDGGTIEKDGPAYRSLVAAIDRALAN